MSKIVLETRRAIIEQVKRSIPKDFPIFQLCILLGVTGKGKSTALCFLRGDEMKLINDSFYESEREKEETDKIISHDSKVSGTFLPNVAINPDGYVLVDFPGFCDTNGPVVALGMDLALKALVGEYNPIILLLEDIVAEDRHAGTAELTKKMTTLLMNMKESCVLGITKYSRYPEFRDIKRIEDSQIEELRSPSEEEMKTSGGIETLRKYSPNSQKEIQLLETELLDLQNKSKRTTSRTGE